MFWWAYQNIGTGKKTFFFEEKSYIRIVLVGEMKLGMSILVVKTSDPGR